MYKYIYWCIHIHNILTCIYISKYIHICLIIYKYAHIYIHLYICIYNIHPPHTHIHIHMYAHMHTCIHRCTCRHTYTCICTYTCTHLHVCIADARAYMYTHGDTYMCTCRHRHTCTHVHCTHIRIYLHNAHTCMHTLTHTCTHIHMHMNSMQSESLVLPGALRWVTWAPRLSRCLSGHHLVNLRPLSLPPPTPWLLLSPCHPFLPRCWPPRGHRCRRKDSMCPISVIPDSGSFLQQSCVGAGSASSASLDQSKTVNARLSSQPGPLAESHESRTL